MDAAVNEVRVGVAEYAGAVPVPAETRTEPVATAANLESAVVPDAYNRSPIVYDDWPVPPLAATSVPATVIAPVVAVVGVSPVVPKLIEVTALEDKVPHEGGKPVFPSKT